MKIIRNILLIFSLIFVGWSFGQQTEHFTQYQFNQFAFNPAVGGTKSCIDVRSGYRYQWVGIEGAPQIGFINAHAPLRFSKKNRNSFGPKHGIGGQIKRDVFGPYSFLQAHVAYSLHIPISMHWKISVGAAFGLKQANYNASLVTTELADPVVPNSSQSFIVFPDGQLGFWIADKRTYAGLAVHNVFGNTLKLSGTNMNLQRHFYFTAGRKFPLENKWSLIPSIFMLATAKTPLDFHLSVLLDKDNKFDIGVGLRRTDAITMQFRVKLFNFISIGYSFDYVISKLGGNMWYTHELTGGFNSCSNYGNSSTTDCPTFE